MTLALLDFRAEQTLFVFLNNSLFSSFEYEHLYTQQQSGLKM